MDKDYREVSHLSEEIKLYELSEESEMKIFETQIHSCNEIVGVDHQRNPNPDPDLTELYNLYLLADAAEFASQEREREKELEKKNLVEEEEEEEVRKNSLNLLIPKRKRSRRLNLNNDFKEFDSSMYERCWREENIVTKPPIVIEEEEEESKIVKKEIKTAAARVVTRKRPRSVDDNIDIAKKKKKIKNWVVFKLTPPNLPVTFREKIQWLQGTDLVLVIQKVLHGTDVSRGHCRMSIPLTQIKDHKFLTEDETARLNTQNGKKMTEIEVLLIEPNQKVSSVGIRKWKMQKPKGKVSYVYNLVKNWNKVVENNKLCEDIIVQLWAFRGAQSQLCFVLVKIGRIDDNARVCLDGHEAVGISTSVGGSSSGVGGSSSSSSRAVNGDGNSAIGESSGATGIAMVEERVILKLKMKKPISTTDLE